MSFVLKRLGQAVVVLFGVTVVVFALLQFVPGDPVRLAMGTRYDPDVYAARSARPRGSTARCWSSTSATSRAR